MSATAADSALPARFLNLLAEGDVDSAADLLHPDVVYTNVSLPAIRGRERVRKAMKSTLGMEGAGFEVYIHATGTDGDVVLNERTDAITFRRLRVQFWVFGRFEVRDGQITVWRDSFDWLNITAATIRGVIGTLVPALQAKAPAA